MQAASTQFDTTPDTISAAHCRSFIRYLRSRDTDPGPVLERAGLDPADAERPEVMLPIGQFLDFLQACEQATNDAYLGLYAGAAAQIEDLDQVGLPMHSASGEYEAFETLPPHGDVWQAAQDANVSLRKEGIVCTQIRFGGMIPPRVLGEYFAARTFTLLRAMAGDLKLRAARFTHDKPEQLAAYRHVFGPAKLEFGDHDNELIFPTSTLTPNAPSAPHGTDAGAEVIEFAPQRLSRGARAFDQVEKVATSVRALLAENLARGDLSLSAVARQLQHSDRTLRRRLRACGTSYQCILDEVRHEYAKRYLDAGLSVAEVSSRVGFRETATIYRAFKRWTGRSLTEARDRRC